MHLPYTSATSLPCSYMARVSTHTGSWNTHFTAKWWSHTSTVQLPQGSFESARPMLSVLTILAVHMVLYSYMYVQLQG